MIIADTSVWINAFIGRDSPEVTRLSQYLANDDVILGDVILHEILRGEKSERAFADRLRTMSELDIVPMLGKDAAIVSAQRYRTLRKHGITVRKPNDAVIASYCITHHIPLLYQDRDFDGYVTHLGLQCA